MIDILCKTNVNTYLYTNFFDYMLEKLKYDSLSLAGTLLWAKDMAICEYWFIILKMVLDVFYKSTWVYFCLS